MVGIFPGSSPTATPSSGYSAPSSPNNTTKWAEQRRYLGLELIKNCRASLEPVDQDQEVSTSFVGAISA